MPKRHRHSKLSAMPLEPTKPVPGVPIAAQIDHMRELQQLQNKIADRYWARDERMAALALSNALSRADMAIATGLAKSRIDQILREVATHHADQRRVAGAERVARHRAM